MLNSCGIVVAILKMAIGRNFFIFDMEKFLAVAISKMAAKIQHCPISSKFDMWVDNDVPKESIRGIIIYPHMKWC
jgi:hypothetical protein